MAEYHLDDEGVRVLKWTVGRVRGAGPDYAPTLLPQILLGKVIEVGGIAKGSYGTVNVMLAHEGVDADGNPSKGSEATATETIEAYARVTEFATNDLVYCLPVGNAYEIVPADCEAA